jgi:hypothetical protein
MSDCAKIGVDSPIPTLGGIGKRRAPHWSAESAVIEIAALCSQADTSMSRRLSRIGQLGHGSPNWKDIGPSRITGTSKFTDGTGKFLDTPYGLCWPSNFTAYTFTQPISILLHNTRYPVRTNNVTVSGTSQGHGSITNGTGGDIQKSRP